MGGLVIHYWNNTIERLDSLKAGKFADQVAELQLAINQSMD
ncbi:hypothetical protein GARC_4698 [Paraglaciecola arctica BSs20135]|uniref:Uncharacterized protein n=1 Tax=Paraglaciecola arctica BSs20135 TaxID=493475 RepID=K6XLU5_9ALTE|nr:hypothetical protein GARC_4698 [Paraglaciecola arctica BSs20135]